MNRIGSAITCSVFLTAFIPVGPVAPAAYDPELAVMSNSCADVIAYSLQNSGSLYWRRLKVVSAIQSDLGLSDDDARYSLFSQLSILVPNRTNRQQLIEEAIVALDVARADALCQGY